MRALTDGERAALENRVRDLTPALLGYQRPEEDDRIAASLGEMFGSFRSMRDKGADAAATLTATMRTMEPFPAWAVERACEVIRGEGYDVDGRRERHWPPSDGEIVVMVKEAERLRREALDSAQALLNAPVSEDGR